MDPTQTQLYRHRIRLEARNFRFRKWRNFIIREVKTKALISFQLKLLCYCTTQSVSQVYLNLEFDEKYRSSWEMTGIQNLYHILPLRETHLLLKYWFIPSMWWLCCNMTEKLLTGTLNLEMDRINQCLIPFNI